MKIAAIAFVLLASFTAQAEVKSVTELQLCLHGSGRSAELATNGARDLLNAELARSTDSATTSDIFGTKYKISRPFKVSASSMTVLRDDNLNDGYFATSCVVLTK